VIHGPPLARFYTFFNSLWDAPYVILLALEPEAPYAVLVSLRFQAIGEAIGFDALKGR